ncbi:RNA-binding S4 domain-containing protein [Ureaplasma sp. ES3154-GEN]|uniref:RNA-binding S4 domain-containing protein n=1 Tax=Ureaplasma sp. ES3154-GEN TaxID=2984844 RepID=UPI0021E9A91A|nr:RNA-binding S4 domain-containing protein [Ureaplasma sp. ES3154-GEN]MCV3743787.1 RNA-binding S4 domain-containing protein [Ureaplasma sp. ES3154-GEN]
MKKVLINTPYITLGQFLKLANFVSSGSEVKFFLMHNRVLVNNEHDERRGRKLYDYDKVLIDDQVFQIVLSQSADN